MNEKKIVCFVFGLVVLLCGCRTSAGISSEILDYQRQIAELEARNRELETRIEYSNRGLETSIGRLESIQSRSEGQGNTVDEIIRLLDEYQQGVEQLLSDYRRTEKEVGITFEDGSGSFDSADN